MNILVKKMSKEKKELKLIENPTFKLISIIILTLVLILIAIILFDDVGLDQSMLIYNIFGTLTLIGFLYSFQMASNKLYNALSFGVSRKKYYLAYLKNIVFVLLIALLFGVYYIFIYKLIIDTNVVIFVLFDLNRIIYLPTLFLSLSFLGFLFGIAKMKRGYLYLLAILITTAVVVSILFLDNQIVFSSLVTFLGLVVIILGLINYYLVKNIEF